LLQNNLFEIWLFLRYYPYTILEIGTRTGMSLFNKLAFRPNGAACLIMSTDLYVEQGLPNLVERNLRQMKIGTSGVCYMRGDSQEVVPALAAAMAEVRYKYILVDASHEAEGAWTDMITAIPLLAPGRIIVFDDAGPTEDGTGYNLISVWDDVMTSHSGVINNKHYDVPYGSCVGRRSAA
jgi:predicted O-methyltransferase YrrM